MTITCPRCGVAFETRTTTNTRCRRCRYVVRIGRSATRPASSPVDDTTVDDYPTADEAAASIVVLASVVVGVLVLAVPRIVEAVRRHRANTEPTFAHDGAMTEPAPFLATAADDATWEHIGPSTGDVNPAV